MLNYAIHKENCVEILFHDRRKNKKLNEVVELASVLHSYFDYDAYCGMLIQRYHTERLSFSEQSRIRSQLAGRLSFLIRDNGLLKHLYPEGYLRRIMWRSLDKAFDTFAGNHKYQQQEYNRSITYDYGDARPTEAKRNPRFSPPS